MPAKRSRQGCGECRKRRRKCDESKPTCSQCAAFQRICKYTLKVVWAGHGHQRQPGHVDFSAAARDDPTPPPRRKDGPSASLVHTAPATPRQLPNGISMPPRYQKLLDYFARQVLASLSTHPSIHQDLCRGLVPAAIHSPHLLSASLALSAAGFLSRGITQVDGTDIVRVMEHLQSSGLSLLRTALGQGQMNDVLLATCLIWCLADVFAAQQGVSSWRIHLQGIEAILCRDSASRAFLTSSGGIQLAMRHLYQLYLSLQTLPHLPSLDHAGPSTAATEAESSSAEMRISLGSNIDGFLGYSEEVLGILRRINVLASTRAQPPSALENEADMLLGKVKGMIRRDESSPLNVSTITSLSPESGRDFALCHRIFQHATLIHLYRRLYDMPSGSEEIQSAVWAINQMVSSMTQGQPCHTWVAMAMPLFTIGCEAFSDEQKAFVVDKVDKLETCLGSLHVKIVRQALEEIWQLRFERHDFTGSLCASQFLDKVHYNIILF